MSQLGLGTEQPGRRARRKQKRGCVPVLIAFVAHRGARLSSPTSRASTSSRTPCPAPRTTRGDGIGLGDRRGPRRATRPPTSPTRWRRPTWSRAAEAFIDAAEDNPESTSIQVGFYDMQQADVGRERPGADARDRPQRRRGQGHHPRGSPVQRGARHDRRADRLQQSPAAEGLRQHQGARACPTYAEGNPEGYLFPATYQVTPNMTAADLLKTDGRRVQEAGRRDWISRVSAKALGMSPHDIVTIASLVQGEASTPRTCRRSPASSTTGSTSTCSCSSTRPASTPSTRSGVEVADGEHQRRRLAVQHLRQHRPAADADQLTRRRCAEGGAQPGRHGLSVLRHGQPRDRRRPSSPTRSRSTSRTSASTAPTAKPRMPAEARARAAGCSAARSRIRCRRCCTELRTRALDLDWEYDAHEVTEASLPGFIAGLDATLARAVADDAAQA